MPIINDHYENPGWVNGEPPAIDADEMNAISNAVANHAIPAADYGAGTATNFGHVKLTDTPTAAQDAASGIAASAKAVSECSKKTVTGTYVGNGQYGQAHPNTLTFPGGVPYVINIAPTSQIVTQVMTLYPTLGKGHSINQTGLNPDYDVRTVHYIYCNVSGNTVSWHSKENAVEQCNSGSETYRYFAMF